ncbi:MAG: Do family serine endopeptidase [Nitrospinaceae bacterium]|nr:Do family serine endopeptidase [Nitrospinaceae bacterium]NIR56890.1 Do family serine endopeptidase [Nitrospinaceae bacterium]NIS87351.1 Do family serine endopeptidase [Nitrospinaceae bacterium]NIT84207.1 Do family serine endopeptidase [Nitrospinaceae bacterium]NIU46391.1 Do family serine endopeptidase [Nitrospinaceae bacterium]
MRPRLFLSFHIFLGLTVFLGGAGPLTAHEPDLRRTPIVAAVQKVGPAVVNIFTEEAPRNRKNPFRQFFGDRLFEQFFKDYQPFDSKRRSLGSGIIIDPKGYILTNEHVVAKAVRVKVTLIDNREFEGRVVGADIKTDLAVIKIDSKAPLPFVEMGRSKDLMIGETVLAIGNPFGLKHTVTTGIISALDRTIRAGKQQVYSDFIQVDASINPGNSGGPLLNINGSLIGINTAIFQDAQGIGFAIPIDKARRIVNDLLQYGKVRRGWLGVSVHDLTPNVARHFGLDHMYGVLVTNVFRKSPAFKAGIKPGDLLLTIEGHELEDKSDYFRKVASYTIDDSFWLTYWHDKHILRVQIHISPVPASAAREMAKQWLGVTVRDIDWKLAKRYRIMARSGVVVMTVNPKSASGKVGIRPGDIIRQMNDTRIKKASDFNTAILEAGKLSSVLLLVQRGRNSYYVTLEP